MQGLLRALRKAGAKSSASRGCGVHIHVGLKSEAGDHTAKTLTNLANMMAAHEEQIGRAIRISERRTERYCRTVSPVFLSRLNAQKPQTMEQLADIWYEGNCATTRRNEHYNESRYHMLNLHACFTKGTIEFRLFQFDEPGESKKGGIHCGQLKAYIQLCLAMSQLAKELKSAKPKPQQRENEKYAFRCWMLRLGFISEEFKTARTLLKVVSVEARTEREAHQRAWDAWNNKEVILGMDDFEGAEMHVLGEGKANDGSKNIKAKERAIHG